jgi:hypothetical protein
VASFIDPKLFLFPGFARRDQMRGGWWVRVEGSAIDFGRVKLRRKLMTRVIARAMKLYGPDVTSEPFHTRFAPFTANPCRRSVVAVDFNDESVMRLDTSKTGRFHGWFWIAPSDDEPWRVEKCDGDHQASVRVTLEPRQVSTDCRIRFIEPQGVSIISDIDDTIKETRASIRLEVLANTFTRPFKIIEGVNDAFRLFEKAGVEFHYVSSSPWQLIDPMTQLLQQFDFPPGTLHLREYRIRDQMFRKKRTFGPRGKLSALKMLCDEFPQRKFILIGDSGESDPELYSHLCNDYPDRILGTFIRDLPGHALDHARLERLKKLSILPITIYQTTEQLKNLLIPILENEAISIQEFECGLQA